ncbi:MAG: TetR/AcrR family transcriptional regulator [Oscillospiraceae bacterium]|nr:TetR/AcrR family transcriptional regulator [Oscillospiraceae bacterium]
MNKNESKYFNTARKMNEALINLIDKKDFEYVTVKEICEMAGVNRSTFYLHYENISELLEETTRYIIDGFLAYFTHDKSRLVLNVETTPINDLQFIRPEYIMPYLSYVRENRRVFKTAVKHLGTLDFDNVYERMFFHIFNPILERFNIPANEREYTMKFYLTGITAMVMDWLKNDCRESDEDICRIIIRCIDGRNR